MVRTWRTLWEDAFNALGEVDPNLGFDRKLKLADKFYFEYVREKGKGVHVKALAKAWYIKHYRKGEDDGH